ncbi:MAG: type IVB secretion system coupling complex protein DotM/IcmP [bacterium]
MAEQQQQQGQDNALDFLWIIGIVTGIIFLTWYFGRVYITSVVFFVRFYEIIAVNFVFDMLAKMLLLMGLPAPHSDLSEWLVLIQHSKGATSAALSIVDFSTLVKLSTVVGNYIRYPLTAIMLGVAALLHFGSPSAKLRNVFDNKSLRIAEQDNWPQIKPILGFDLVKQKLDEGPWAISLSPMRFCKKHDLLDIEEKYGKYIATLRRGTAYRLLSLQLGPKWYGAENLPPYLKALFAVFAAKVNGDKKSAEDLLDQLAVSSKGQEFNFKGVEELMRKYVNSKKVVQIVSLHGYITTVLASMLVGARSAGVLATAEFLWLKPIDRRMWYMLNSVGRQTAVTEISGAFAHWLAEKKLGLPLMVPMVEEAVRGLEIVLAEMIYKPDEEE